MSTGSEAQMRIEVVDEERTRDLRRRVLRPNRPPDAPLPGDELTDAVHFAALDDDTVLGTCFVYPDPCPWWPDRPESWHLRQMATAEEQRGRGVGSAVLAAVVAYVRDRGGRLLWCNAREGAVGFYARHGLEPHGEIFIDEHHPVPHLRMWRDLDR